MTEAEARSLFTLAGIEVLRVWQLQNGYGGHVLQEYAARVRPLHVYEEGRTLLDREALDFLNTALPAARSPWWLVKTPFGLVEIGWRKRVIAIDWSDTAVRAVVTGDDVTKSEAGVHAWSTEKALEYLKALNVRAAIRMRAAVREAAL